MKAFFQYVEAFHEFDYRQHMWLLQPELKMNEWTCNMNDLRPLFDDNK